MLYFAPRCTIRRCQELSYTIYLAKAMHSLHKLMLRPMYPLFRVPNAIGEFLSESYNLKVETRVEHHMLYIPSLYFLPNKLRGTICSTVAMTISSYIGHNPQTSAEPHHTQSCTISRIYTVLSCTLTTRLTHAVTTDKGTTNFAV